ncbi:hypothetical protein CRYUN_Cryun35bG0065100 [Craigia yunnanensis]
MQISGLNERPTPRNPARWTPPVHDSVKLNVDAAYCSTTKIASLGMIVRDETGAICLSAVMKTGSVDSPLQVEFKAIAFGLERAKAISFPSILLGSD